MIKRFVYLLTSAFCLLTFPVVAQDSPYTPVSPLSLGDTLLTLPTSRIPAEGTWEVKFTHRFNQSIDSGNGSDRVHSLFGLDSNADVLIGVSYAVRPDLQLTFVRTNTNDTIETSAKYVLWQQAEKVPVSVALRAGGDWRTEKDLTDRTTLFAQAIISRQFGRKAQIFILPTYATKAGRGVAGTTSAALFDHAFNVPVGFAWMLKPSLSVVAEVIPPNRDLPDSINADLGWAIGLKRAIGGHYFEILLTNSNGTTVDQYVSSTYQGTALDSGDIHLGFNIERRFGKRRR